MITSGHFHQIYANMQYKQPRQEFPSVYISDILAIVTFPQVPIQVTEIHKLQFNLVGSSDH